VATHGVAQHNRAVLFEPSAQLYAAVFPKIWRYVTPAVGSWMTDRLQGRQRVLDAGTGSGHWLGLAGSAEPRRRLVGIDISDAFLSIARTRLAETGAELYKRDMANSEFYDGEFDAVICAGVLDTVPNPGAILREFDRVLANGGILLLVLRPSNTRASKMMETVFRLAIGASCAWRTKSLRALHVPETMWRRSSITPELGSLADPTGLELAEIRQDRLTTLVAFTKPTGR
jgi:ubiquinone/menaquinone biosynthesis C-methylase UbiE